MRSSRWRRLRRTLALLLGGLLASGAAGAQVQLSVEPAMTKGAADAPVVIVEFSDYQ